MTTRTPTPRIQNIPWSPAEEAAYRVLVEHTGGTETTGPCPRCNSPERDCETGTEMRRALRDATRARSNQTPNR
ncbi:hypothetical protein OG322_16995 [Streptomyces sp. NBC_01260]|uniref:hypothetical protein n=1 Tax=unclassified Streptomyces TaxID=2593676 RepID=UPI000F554A3E|nr:MULTISPECIES: hypothetical protein [unclassified Streptomyces]ROQ81565.1 hypothetical protein EDD95_1150 [Streptomyces sp. CEV 2-1]RPK47031.1 hypothetical protein EES39_12620 [Streptomyces sp. ADI92-24]